MTLEKKDFQEMMTRLEGLPAFNQAAVKWALCHWNLVESLCMQEPPISVAEFKRESQKAIDTHDYAYYAILVYLKVISQGKETGIQE